MSRSLYARLAHRFGPKIDPMTRREMLRGTLAAAGGLLISGPVFASLQDTRPRGKRVVVIGGGFSGLACAHELLAAGYQVTVVEGRPRVGGRVFSSDEFVRGKNVELGGELIGSNHPAWVSYAAKFGLEFIDVTEAEDMEFPILLDGKRLGAKEAEELYEAMEAAVATMNADAAKVDADEPWKSEGAAAWDRRPLSDWIAKLSVPDLCRKAVTIQMMADNGADCDKQSYLGNLAMVKGGGIEKFWTESEVYRCKGGNGQLARKLADAVGGDRLRVGLKVTEIALTDKGATVKCADGRTLECDDVVLAAPQTTWDKIRIEPGLPAALKPSMGVNTKYLMSFKNRFWKAAGLAPDALAEGDVNMTWELTDNQPGEEGFALNAFNGGSHVKALIEKPAEAMHKAYADALEKLYPGIAAQIVDKRFMNWPKDPWTLGSYSFPAPGEVTTVGPLLKKGHGNGRLHFAGEYACYKFIGYMEGALTSGVEVAKRLAMRDGAVKG